ncbi:MAG TPA: FAD-dependent monooxygenase [Rhodopila sp.]|uniref:FAD-dependent monooxygenase n=1 Tax=Rhodopila sp. TaxID=2480087 RepID=UPI002BF65436|nr:FAD-dependent monooxygenase [Rhodopila sp.]HVY17293.1 FAD-dependent monooxygenase [Rhodopila sp.]
MTLPILIVGAGPVGLTMASELIRFGVPVRIVDKAGQRTDKSKALVIWSRTLELLDRGGGAAPFISAGCRVGAVEFVAGDKAIGRITMEHVDSPYAFGLMLPQSETERLLEERLVVLGGKVERSVEMISFATDDTGAKVVLRHADGCEEPVATPWLIGCDGAHSAVRHGVGAVFAGETMDSDWLLADVHLRGYPHPDTAISVYWHQEGALVLFPISPGRYRVVADRPASGDALPPTPTLAEVQALLDRRGAPGMVAFNPIWLSGFRINERKVAAYRYGHAFLAGDAAHIHSPAGGQGMNTGMQDAFNLAWKLALVERGACGGAILDSYSPERSKVADAVLAMAGRMTEVGTLHNPIAQRLRNLAGHLMLGLSVVRDAMAQTMSEVTIGYPDSPLNGVHLEGGPGPRPGERVRPTAGQTPPGSGGDPRFALFADPGPAIDGLLARFGRLLDPALRPPLAHGAIWLVRPDGYVACTSVDGAAIAAYLDRLVQ